MILTLVSDKEEAFRLVHDEYVHAGLMRPHPSGLRTSRYHDRDSTKTIVAIEAGSVVGTVSLVVEDLPLEQLFNVRAGIFANAKLVEVSSLAVSRKHRGRQVLFNLFSYLTNYSINFLKADYLVIAVNPQHIALYEDLLCFTRIGEANVYDFVEGLPAIGAYLDLRTAAEVWKQKRFNIYKQFFVEHNPLEAFIYPLPLAPT